MPVPSKTLPSKPKPRTPKPTFGPSSGLSVEHRRLVIIQLLRGRVFFLFQEHELRVEEEEAFFWQPRSAHGPSLTCGSDAIPVLLRPCSLIALRTALYLLPPLPPSPSSSLPQAPRAASQSSALVGVQFFRQSAEPSAAPPTSPFMALLMHPLAVKAQARLSALFISLRLHDSFSATERPDCCWPNTLPISSLISHVSQSCSRKFQFRVSVRAFWHFSQQQAATTTAPSCGR